MTITLITGGTKGLGHETARRLADAGHDVWLTGRDPGRGRVVASGLGARFVELDVTDDASAAAAAAEVQDRCGRLDVLINNAGVRGTRLPVAEVEGDDVQRVFQTNVFGIVRVVHAFVPLLQRSPAASVINLSSGLGSFHQMTETEWAPFGNLAYSSSKAAVTMLTLQYARALAPIRFNAVDPGYTATDLNGHTGTQTVQEGTDAVVRLATLGEAAPTGTFTDRNGAVPW